jgi:predicted RNA-binding Zn-ribbon protein involved in translation (DUF1610 family)
MQKDKHFKCNKCGHLGRKYDIFWKGTQWEGWDDIFPISTKGVFWCPKCMIKLMEKNIGKMEIQ